MKIKKIKPKFRKKQNPKIGLITLASDFRIEKDFNEIINHKEIDLYCNRIHSYNPLTNKNLKKMANDITQVTKDILPSQKLDCDMEKDKGCKITMPDKIGEETIYLLEKKL